MCAGLVYLLLAVASFPASASTNNLRTPSAAPLAAPYSLVRASFWHAEKELQARMENGEARRELFSVLPTDDPLRAEYLRAASADDEYLKLAGENKLPAVPAMLYLGGLAKYSIGDSAGALALLERLRAEYPDYKRDQYLNDRDDLNPQYSVPVSAGVSKLVFYLRLQVALKNTPDAFASLKQITSDALTTLGAQREYSGWIAARNDKYNVRDFDESIFGSEPDQRRAAVLPSTLSLVNEAWDKLIEPALQKSGAQAMRDWLRGLSNPNAPLSKLALYRLQSIDALIIKQYFADAQNLLNAHNFDGARAKYRQLIAEYPGTETAQRAAGELPKIAPIAVAFYAAEGAQHFQPETKGQFLQEQSKAADDYARMYREATAADVQGDDAMRAQAETALLGWARADATQSGKLGEAASLLQKHLNDYPQSPARPQALLLLGMIEAGSDAAQRQAALGALGEIVQKYPQSEEAPEALWKIGVLHFAANRKTEASKTFEQLGAQYPKSPRAQYVAGWIVYLKKN